MLFFFSKKWKTLKICYRYYLKTPNHTDHLYVHLNSQSAMLNLALCLFVLLNILNNILDLLLLAVPQITSIPITIMALKLTAHYIEPCHYKCLQET